MASYSYKVIDSTQVTHFIASSEIEHGVHCSLIQETTSIPTKQPSRGGYLTSNSSGASITITNTTPSSSAITTATTVASNKVHKSNSLAELTAAVKAITNNSMPSMPSLSPPLFPTTPTSTPSSTLTLVSSSHKRDKKQAPATKTSLKTHGHQQSHYLDEFVMHASLVKKLYEDRPKQVRRDVAYLKVSQPGKSFDTYDREKYRLPMTMNAYFEVLKFFKQEYRMVENRMEADYKNMLERKEWLSVCPSIAFRGGADIEFKMPVDMSNGFTLDLVIRKSYESGKKSIYLEYSEPSMGKILLPGSVMEELSQDLSFLMGLCNGDYKETLIHKRSRQY